MQTSKPQESKLSMHTERTKSYTKL